MSIDDLRTLAPRSSVEADVCIVGSGPAGLTLAAELADTGMRIVVLESGGRSRDPWAEAMGEIVSVGAPRVVDQGEVRNRVLGGSSDTWGGRLATLDNLDFQERRWVPGSGWPITRETLMPYYKRAAGSLCTVMNDNNDPAAVGLIASQIPQASPELLRPYVWSYSRHDSSRRDFMRHGVHAQQSRMEGITCFVQATVTQIEVHDSGDAVRRVEVRAPDGELRWIVAPNVVLCAGGIENSRLLLASTRQSSSGIGNSHGLVGRFLMDHLRGPVAWFARRDENHVQRVFGDFLVKASSLPAGLVPPGAKGTGQLTPGYALSPTIQETEGLLNCALFIKGEPAQDDPLDAALSLMRLQDPVENVKRLLRHPWLTAEAAERPLLHGRLPVRRVDGLGLHCIVEQRPDRDSRVMLDGSVDALGVPLTRIDWRISDQEVRTVRRTTELFIEQMRRLRLPTPTPLAMISDPGAEFFLPDVAHPTGTTRMAADPAQGVVNADLAVHGVDGLYVVGSSVFPTAGHANPTHTIVALAIRLADHLRAVSASRATAFATRADRSVNDEVNASTVASDSAGSSEPDSRTVLVTGASGRIGKRVVAILRREGFSVRALTSRFPPAPAEGIEWRVHDLRQADLDFREDARGCVGIVHLAAEQTNVDDMYRINVEATEALARAAESAGVRAMVYTSTMSVYGAPRARRVTEDTRVLTSDRDVPSEYWEAAPKRAYARTKLQGELRIAAVAKRTEYLILRPTAVYAPADLVDMAHWTPRARSALWNQRSHAVNVDDVAESIVWLLQRSLGRPVPKPSVSVYNVSDEVKPTVYGDIWQAFNDGVTPAPSEVALKLPSVMVWALYWLWHRGRPRRLVGQADYQASKLYAEGYSHTHGVDELVERAVAEYWTLDPAQP